MAAAFIAGLFAAGAFVSPAEAATPPAPPVITRVTPLKLTVGDTLTISGRHFVAGKGHNVVAFQRSGQRAVFLKADSATTTKIKMRIPAKLVPYFRTSAGKAVATKFRLRVLSRRFAKAFTSVKASPLISPEGSTSAPVPPADCDKDGIPNSQETDSDNDGLSNDLETQIGTQVCGADSDGDGIPDGYEYWAGRDLNRNNLPYAGKRPFPNALFADPGVDHDSDGLTEFEEYTAWARYGGGKLPLEFSSDGSQNSGGIVPANGSATDYNGNGRLTDDERDYDQDGLGNWVEAHGPLVQAWWSAAYSKEKAYELTYPQLDWLDKDSDGDGIPDGADDQDHDGYSNVNELLRITTWVQPYNPCLPDPTADTCSLHPPATSVWPPFDPGYNPAESIPLAWPR